MAGLPSNDFQKSTISSMDAWTTSLMAGDGRQVCLMPPYH